MKKYYLLFFFIIFRISLYGQELPTYYKDLIYSIKENNFTDFKTLFAKVDNINRFIPENLEKESYNKLTLLGFACAYKRNKIVEFLLEKKADLNLGVEDDYYVYDALYSIYQKYIKKTKSSVIGKLLLEKDANPNIVYGDNTRSILHIACSKGDYAMVKLLLDNGADPNNSGNSGIEYKYYPLIEAVKNSDYRIIKLLLDAGADISVKDEYNKTALDYGILSKKK